MNEVVSKQIFEAVKQDNLKLFSSLVQSNSDLSLCFGRFPLLSVCYLFKSYHILSKYEKFMFRLSNFTKVEEIAEIYNEFKAVAGKFVRFYDLDSTVYPIEVLALLKDNETIAKNYKKLFKNAEIIENLKKIYNLDEKSKAEIKPERFTSKQNKFSKSKKILLTASVILFCFMLVFPISVVSFVKTKTGLGTRHSPILIRNEKELKTALSYSGKTPRTYILSNDIVLTDNFVATDFSGTIYGGGRNITLSPSQENCLIQNLSGNLFDLNFKISSAEILVQEDYSFLTNSLSGRISNCQVFGEIDATFNIEEDTYLSIFAVESSGYIENSVSNVSVRAENNSNKNAFFASFCGKNSGFILRSETNTVNIETDTVDVAGIVCENNGTVDTCKNSATVTQTTDKEWNPNTAGIAINNSGNILGSENNATITSRSENKVDKNSDNPDGFAVFVGGIACTSTNEINSSKNTGEIVAGCETGTVYAGGIVAFTGVSEEGSTLGKVYGSKSLGKISVQKNETDGREIFVGGIVGLAQGAVDFCGFEGEVAVSANETATTSSKVFVGGIAGRIYMVADQNGELASKLSNCYSSLNCKQDYYKGAIVGSVIVPYDPFSGAEPYLAIEFQNCHYVLGGNVSYGAYYQCIITGEFSTPAIVTDRQELKSYSSLENLKKNAKGVNAND